MIEHMVSGMIVAFLGVLGLIMGSFAGASVWRLRARQLLLDVAAGEKINQKEHKRLEKLRHAKSLEDRSVCLDCGHQLVWYDLIPLVSWLSTRGRCRYCHKPIGSFEPLIELATAVLFVASYLFWPFPLQMPLDFIQLIIWYILAVGLVILFAYDYKWFILPDVIVYTLAVIAVFFAGITVYRSGDVLGALMDLGGALLILSGLYLAVWAASRGKWIGFGDVKLGVVLALIVGTFQLAFVALLVANVIGCLIVIPGMIAGKLNRTSQIPFGPLLIVGAVSAFLGGRVLLSWYFSLLG